MKSISLEDLFRVVPLTRQGIAYAGDPLVYLDASIRVFAKEAVEDATKGPPGARRRLFLRPQSGGEWILAGDADSVHAGEAKSLLRDFDDEDGVEFDVRWMTDAEVEALPEHGGW